MRDIKVTQKVRTNNRWRAFFKTKEVIRGLIVGFFYDHKTAVILGPDEKRYKIHRDWLELDRKRK